MAGPGTAASRRRGDVEYALYMLVSGMCSLAVYWAARNAARPPGTQVKGPFARSLTARFVNSAKPTVPLGAGAVPGNRQAVLTWTKPAKPGGARITDYVVETSRDGSTWSAVPHTASNATSMTLSGLAPGTTYQVRIATKTAVGTSETLAGSFTTVAGPPLAPQNLAATSV